MPSLDTVCNTGPEWLLHLLERCSEDERLPVLMTVWRTWHVHNEITHHKPAPPTEASRRFLSSYIDSLLCIQQHPNADVSKGKMVVNYNYMLKQNIGRASPAENPRPPERWAKPSDGWCKLNVDGAFVEAEGSGAAGMILRNHHGEVIFASCRFLPKCSSAVEAEFSACLEGVSLALEWSTDPFILETDCTTAASMLMETEVNRSLAAAIIEETKHLLRLGRPHIISHVRRDKNHVSHSLAQMGRQPRTAIWLRHAPGEILSLCTMDCDPPD